MSVKCFLILYNTNEQLTLLWKFSFIKNIEINIESPYIQIQDKEQLVNNLIDIKVLQNPSFDDITFTTKYYELTSSIRQLSNELVILEKDYIGYYDTKNNF